MHQYANDFGIESSTMEIVLKANSKHLNLLIEKEEKNKRLT